jgi:alginate O-acetyltransferase complex protein AlgF
MTMFHRAAAGLAALIALPAAAALAQDDALYAPAPPAGAAFVRVINATTDKGAATVGGGDAVSIGVGEATAYAVVEDDTVAVALDGRTADVPAADGTFVSVVMRPGADPLVLVDAAGESRGKATVTLYNLTGTDGLALKTGDGSIEVVAPVAPGASGSRAVNPLSIGFAVFDGTTSLAEIPTEDLRGGQAYAVVVTASATGPKARWIVSSTAAN